MPTNRFNLAVTAASLADDPRRVPEAARRAGVAGVLFDAYSPALDIPELSQTGRREFRHRLAAQQQQIAGLQVDLGGKGLGPGADVDHLLSRLERAMEAARSLAAPLVCVDLGPVPAPAPEERDGAAASPSPRSEVRAAGPAPASLTAAPSPLPALLPSPTGSPGTAGIGTGTGTGLAGEGSGRGTQGPGQGGEGTASEIMTGPDWIVRPTDAQMRVYFPLAAIERRTNGIALLGCQVDAGNRARHCRILGEQPRGFGFGAAGLRFSRLFRIRPPQRDGRAQYDAWVRIPIYFVIEGSR
jgi:protein TonB